jgi:hypothetical protein
MNQESTILVLMFAILVLWRARPTTGRMVAMLGCVTLLVAMKSVFLVLLLLWAATMWPLRPRRLLGLAIVPVAIQIAWSHFVVRDSGNEFLPGGANDPAAQLTLLATSPRALFGMLWHGHQNLFGRGHMTGGWISVLGVLGWAELEIGARAYHFLGWAVALAVLADLGATVEQQRESVWLRHLVPFVSAYLMIPAILIALYVIFSDVGEAAPRGVQGRYLLVPYFMMAAIAIDFVQRRWPLPKLRVIATPLAISCAILCVLAERDALRAVLWRHY